MKGEWSEFKTTNIEAGHTFPERGVPNGREYEVFYIGKTGGVSQNIFLGKNSKWISGITAPEFIGVLLDDEQQAFPPAMMLPLDGGPRELVFDSTGTPIGEVNQMQTRAIGWILSAGEHIQPSNVNDAYMVRWRERDV